MSEDRDRATFYEEHGDDDLWEKPEKAPGSASYARRALQGLTETITVRFSAEEADAIRRIAQAEHITYSDVIRRAVAALHTPRDSVVRLSPWIEAKQGSQGGSANLQLQSSASEPDTEAPHIEMRTLATR